MATIGKVPWNNQPGISAFFRNRPLRPVFYCPEFDKPRNQPRAWCVDQPGSTLSVKGDHFMSIASVIKAKAETTRDDVFAKTDDALAKGARLVDAAEAKASDASDAALKEITALVAVLNEKMSALSIDGDTLGEKARSTYAEVEKFVVKEVADRPMRTLALVGITGLLLGLFSRK
jgi:ElaB/YqjD/DUF883 family membrane-anchored ribosome-binding protein